MSTNSFCKLKSSRAASMIRIQLMKSIVLIEDTQKSNQDKSESNSWSLT
jgi:hypothetical protein